MPGEPGPERDDEGNTIDTDAGDQQRGKAAHLAKRAGEAVERRYDATKEVHHEESE